MNFQNAAVFHVFGQVVTRCLPRKKLSVIAIKIGLILFGFFSVEVQAQYVFRHLGTNENLIQGSNYYFLEDSKGFLWISTQSGLNRFDGHNVKSYVHDELDKTSISKGEVRGLVESPSGDIWLGTEVSLSRYIRQTGQFENYFVKDKHGRPIPSQHQVVYADNSTVIFLNDREGLVRMNYDTGRKQVILEEAEFSYGSRTDIVHFDSTDHTIWLLLPKGLIKINLSSGFKNLFFTGKIDDVFDEALYIYALCRASEKIVWLSTDKGLIKLDSKKYEVHQIGINMSMDLVYSLAIDHNRNIWLATSKSGLIKYDPNSRHVMHKFTNNPFSKNSISRDHLSKVFIDSKGHVWVNADPAGVDVVFSDSLAVQKFEDDPRTIRDFNNASIRGISQDFDGNIWVGTSGEEIRTIANNGTISRPGADRGILHASVRGIFTDSDGGVWVSAVKGLMYLKKGQRNFKEIRFAGPDIVKCNHIKGVIEIKKGVCLIATMGGIFSYSSGHSKLLTAPSEQFSGAMYYREESGELFVGRSDKDLRCYQVDEDTLVPIYDKLAGHNVLDFAEDRKSPNTILWIGTDNGLLKYDIRKREIVKTLTSRDGLPDHVVYAMIFDNTGLMWVSTNNGLARMLPDESILTLRHTRKIEFNSFAAFKAADGSLYFGSAQGLYRINPKSFQYPSSRGLVVTLTGRTDSVSNILPIRYENEPLRLSFNENNLTFELSALDYSFSVEPLYEYRVNSKTMDGKWISHGTSSIIDFQNLPPNEYFFEFRAVDSNGFYTNTQKIWAVIASPFWLTWWFILLICLVSAMLLYWAVKLYVKRQQTAHQKLSGRIILAQESERLRIAMDIHDDVNNTLAAAKGYLQISEITSFENVERSRELILKATEDLRNITHDLMPVQFENNNLPDVLEKRIQEWDEESGIRFAYIFAGEFRKLRAESELMIYRIVTEIVNNIKKHSKASNSVIQLIYQDKVLVVSIEDNGKGLESPKSDNKTMGIGLKNIYSRSEYLRADLEIFSDNNGVLVHLIVPYDYNLDNKNYTG